jgi:hypothetical protein
MNLIRSRRGAFLLSQNGRGLPMTTLDPITGNLVTIDASIRPEVVMK